MSAPDNSWRSWNAHALWERLRQLGPREFLLAFIVVLVGVSFRDLADWDPGRTITSDAPTLFEPSNTSPLFIFSLSVLFVYLRLGRLRVAWSRSRPSAWGWLLLAPAMALYLWAIHTEARDLILLAFIPTLFGGSLLLVGPPFTRVLLLPILFLVFAYPVPAVLANQQIYAFQTGTAELTAWVLHLIGEQAVLEGDLIYARGYIFEVIETCSGLRITETLVASAFAYAELSRAPRVYTVILVLLAPPIAFVLNTVRVLLIIYNPTGDPASDHTLQGLVAIMAGVVCLAIVDRLLTRVMPRPSPSYPPPPPVPGGAVGAGATAWGVAVFVGAMACATFWLPRYQPETPPRWRIVLPAQKDGWVARQVELDTNFLGSVAFSRFLLRLYEKDGLSVEAFLAKDDRLKRDRSALSPKTALPGAGWAVEERSVGQPAWSPVPVEEIVARRRGQRVLIYHWREGTRPPRREAMRALLALDQSPLRTGEELRVFRVSTPIYESRQRARERIELFAASVRTGFESS